jgi:Yip1 domain
MNLVDRVKNVLVSPQSEWPKIAEESATTQSIYTGYVMILGAIGPLALAIITLGAGIGLAIVSYLIALAMAFVLALIVDALAPSFGGQKGFVGSLKLAAYSCTAVWIAAIFRLIPFVGGIIGWIGLIYTFYLFYLGAPVLKKCASEKAVGFTAVVAICALVIGFVLVSLLLSVVTRGGMAGMAGIGAIR